MKSHIVEKSRAFQNDLSGAKLPTNEGIANKKFIKNRNDSSVEADHVKSKVNQYNSPSHNTKRAVQSLASFIVQTKKLGCETKMQGKFEAPRDPFH